MKQQSASGMTTHEQTLFGSVVCVCSV